MKYKIFIMLFAFIQTINLGHAKEWPEKIYNPAPLEDDIVLPLPCDGKMVFRKVYIPQTNVLDDEPISLGQSGTKWSYVEERRGGYIAGSFSDKESRYYLISKYELSEAQYKSVMDEKCPKASGKARLPAVSYTWLNAMEFADKYNIWLRENHPDLIPKDDDVLGFLRLPSEEEWEFAARGGLAVDQAEYMDLHYPMPEGISQYEWFGGNKSSNGRLNISGLLKPNALGIHDILGNVSEMMLEPFRINKLNRLHGQAGGVILRGGNYLTPQNEIRSSSRTEQAIYSDTGANKVKTTGMRFVFVSPVMTSRERVEEIAKEWEELGSDTEQEGNYKVVSGLKQLTSDVEDSKFKKRLQDLEIELRASNQRQEENRDQAIRAALKLGGFLCSKLRDDGRFIDSIQLIYDHSCGEDGDPESAHCKLRLDQLDRSKTDYVGSKKYYASVLVDSASLYSRTSIEKQVPIIHKINKQKKTSNLSGLEKYINKYWDQQSKYFKDSFIAPDEWAKECVNIN